MRGTSKKRVTKKQIESTLPKGYGIFKAEGVYYFVDGDTWDWPETCTHFCTLDFVPLEKWRDTFDDLRKSYEEAKK